MNFYEFYVDGKKFYDVRIDGLALIDPVLELQVNSAGTLTFTMPPTHPNYDDFKPLKSTIEIYRDGEWMWEGRIIDQESDFYNKTKYTVEGALAYLNDSVQPQWEYQGNVIGYVEQILNVHNSQVPDNRKINLGAVTVQDPNNYIQRYTNYNPTLQELKEDITDDLGGFLRLRKVDGKLYLDALEEYGRTCSQIISLGSNLLDLTPSFDYTDIASIIIPLGATLEDQESHEDGLEALDKYVEITEVNDGKNYIGRDDLIEEFDKIWKPIQFNNIHTPEGLLEKAKKYLTDGQWGEMVIEAKAFDLNYTSEEFQEFRLGDRVRVTSKLHGIDRYFPLTAQTIHFNDVAQNTITLGGTGEPVSITGVTNRVSLSNEKLDERIKDPNRLIEQAIWQATQLITQGLNGYVRVDGNEILIMDTDDPATAKHVWRWNMGGLGYSDNGYNGPFETAITMDGTIAGKFLAANSVAAEQLDVNYKSHVERLITDAESGANDYTDGKLKDYWTYSETETYFRTLADSIEAGVNTTLRNYYTSQEIDSKLTITEGNINTSVSNTLKSYSTTNQVQSMIDQAADSITTTLSKSYATKDDLGNLQTSFNSLEQKLTPEGIFVTINNGIGTNGNESIHNTYYTLNKNGITIQNGGITIKNDVGTNVFYADSDGDLTMRGDFIHYGKNTSYKAIGITEHEVQVYAWDDNGNYLGSLGALRQNGGQRLPWIGLWSDRGDDLILGSKESSSGSTINSIIRLGSSSGVYGIKQILGTYSGLMYFGNGIITIANGLISAISESGGTNGNYWIADGYITFSHGLCTTFKIPDTIDGTISIAGTNLTFGRGMLKSWSAITLPSDTIRLGNGGITVGNGVITSWNFRVATADINMGNGYVFHFQNGILTSYSTP